MLVFVADAISWQAYLDALALHRQAELTPPANRLAQIENYVALYLAVRGNEVAPLETYAALCLSLGDGTATLRVELCEDHGFDGGHSAPRLIVGDRQGSAGVDAGRNLNSIRRPEAMGSPQRRRFHENFAANG